MRAGRLRHRIDIQHKVAVRDPGSGEFGEPQWVTLWEKCPAEVTPLSARDLIAAQAGQSQATARMLIRYRTGVLATMRILYRSEIYSIVGPPLEDPGSGREHLTILVSKGVKNG